MSDDVKNPEDEWDPEEFERRHKARKLKVPMTFRRDSVDVPKMTMDVEEPKAAEIKSLQPKIVQLRKNKNALL